MTTVMTQLYDGSFRGTNLFWAASFSGESSAATATTEPYSNEMENHYLIIGGELKGRKRETFLRIVGEE